MNIFQSARKTANDPHIQALLQENEKVLRIATIHSAIYWKGMAVFFIGLYLSFVVKNLGLFLMGVGIITLVIEYLTKYYLLLILTNRRVLIRHGILQLDTIQLHHSRIESIELERTILGRILSYATVLVTGTGSRVMAVPFVADAEALRADIDGILFQREEAIDQRASGE